MLEVFESSEFIWNELNKENYYCDILSAEENLKIKELLNSNAVDIHLKGIEKLNIKAISIDDEEYPKLLKEIYDPPTLLYCKGDLSLLKTDCIAVVGARVCTRYGAEQTTRFTKELVKANFCIVSGLAEGIDGHAHRTALENGGKTIDIRPAGFQDAINLKKAVAKCLLDAGVVKNLDFQGLELTLLIDKIAELLFNAETSNSFEKALFECLKYCYIDENGVKIKITPQLFDEKPELREDYYEIVVKCAEENLRPFFKSLVTEFKTRFNQIAKDQPSE